MKKTVPAIAAILCLAVAYASPAVGPAAAQQASGISAFHRSGQTFLTWIESGVSGEGYHIYRHSAPISSANLSSAERLTERWGPVPEGSSAYLNERERDSPVQRNFIIADGGPELPDGTGLFVWTAHEDGLFYYAVTAVVAGTENRAVVAGENATVTGLTESAGEPSPILVYRTGNGRGFVYTHFMDYSSWNPTLEGYAYNYSVALPPGYDGTDAVPAMIYLQGWGGRYGVHAGSPYDWNSIWIEIDDPRQTWHYGFNADFDYREYPGDPPASGTIVNFTEMRILQAIDEVCRRYRVDANRIHGHGSSMGGSGMLSLGLRYPNVFSAIYAGLPMTDYRAADGNGGSVDWRGDLEPKWGTIAAGLPVENRGDRAAHLASYNGTSVWDWQDHPLQILARRGEETAYICFAHAMQDDVIDWESQGQPFPGALLAGLVGFTGADVPGGHSWPGFVGSNGAMIGTDYDGWSNFQFRRDLSFPALSRASHSPPVPPPASTDENYFYHQDIEWSVPWNSFGPAITDETDSYGLTLRSTSGDQTADITPRRLQRFVVEGGSAYSWENARLADGAVIQSGSVVPDEDGLITVSAVRVLAGGNRLRIFPANYDSDLNNDGRVDSRDLGILMSLWGSSSPTADINADGAVDGGDLAILLGQWGGGTVSNCQIEPGDR